MAGDDTSSCFFNVTVMPVASPETLKLSGLRLLADGMLHRVVQDDGGVGLDAQR
jgi:hypothetical protein